MRLTRIEAGRIRHRVLNVSFTASISNPNEEHMGSTPNGDAGPMTSLGPALPQDIEIDRVGDGRVRIGDRT
jgi:hypothetical protein